MTANAIIAFDFEEQPVRTVERKGEPWFVLADLCRVLGHSNHRMIAARLDEDEKGVSLTYTPGGAQEMIIVNESGMYATILRSRGAATPGTPAHRFRRWVTGEVLPSLRKQGFYGRTFQNSVKSVSTLTALQNQVIRLSGKLQIARNRVERQMMHQMLDRMCQQLGIDTPPLDQLGYDAPLPPDILVTFWNGLETLRARDVPFDHSRVSRTLAINLPEIREHFKEAGVNVEIDTAMRKALRASDSPRFVTDKTVNSRLTGGAKTCWVFSIEP